MTVFITDRDEWERIVAKCQPTLYVSSDRQWFRNAYCTYVFLVQP
jgi:hypothetical protein